MKMEITRATPDMAYRIKLRAADEREARAWNPGVSPADLIAASLRTSERTYAGLEGDELVFLGGYVEGILGPNTVSPWLVGSDLVVKHRVRFLRASRLVLRRIRSAYPDHQICNYVAKDNPVARAYLNRLGFVIRPLPAPMEFDYFFLPPCASEQKP